MSRRSAKVVLLHRESRSATDDWIDHIELRRNAYATFSVRGNRYGVDPVTGRRRWLSKKKTEGLKNPIEVKKAIDDVAQLLGANVEWVDVIPLIASIDWLTAAVIASQAGLDIPSLPDIDVIVSQRSLRTLGRVTIGAEWGYLYYEISLPLERWIRGLCGESWEVSKSDWYEAERFTGVWSFDGNCYLEVNNDESGQGYWSGELDDLEVIEGPEVDGVDLAKLALSASREH